MKNSFDKFGCDKGSSKHRYDRVYEPALKHLKDKEFKMLEVGVFKGNGLESWVDYFSKVQITGIDIFTRVKAKNIPILNHNRVTWCKQNSLEQPTEELLALADSGFDVIIDDGLHTHKAQQMTFENLIPFLKDDGVYFIEDVWPFDHMTKVEKKHWWIEKYPKDYTDEKYQELLTVLKNYKITFHDIRKGYDPDTFIIEVRK